MTKASYYGGTLISVAIFFPAQLLFFVVRGKSDFDFNERGRCY